MMTFLMMMLTMITMTVKMMMVIMMMKMIRMKEYDDDIYIMMQIQEMDPRKVRKI